MSGMVGKPSVIKLLNKDVIEGIIRSKGPITKPQIAKASQLSLVTVNKTVTTLVTEGKVKVSGINESTGGRRAQFFEINYELNYYIGLYYYKNNYIGAISNSVGELLYEQEFPVRADKYEEVMEDTYKALDFLVDKCDNHMIKAIGLGVPGVVKDGSVTNIPNIPSWEGQNLSKLLKDRYQIPVILENDINLTTLGVYTTDYRNSRVKNMALIYLEQGIGSGFIINRALFKGFSNFAGELSHLPVRNYIQAKGKATRYIGDFEAQISLITEAFEQAASEEKEKYKDMLIQTVKDGLLSVICVLNPEIIVMKHNYLTNQDYKKIEQLLGEYVQHINVPTIVNAEDIKRNSIQGVIRMCIRESTPTYSLSNEKRG